MAHSSSSADATFSALERYMQNYFELRKTDYDYGEWFESLYFDLCEFTGRKGKRIRPMLLITGFQTFGGDRPATDPAVLQSAMAMELLHSFILMHDDVIDRSELRRAQPTFHKLAQRRLEPFESSQRHGESIAIVAGDMMFTMAMEAMLDTDFPAELRIKAQKMFLKYAADTGAGEIYDIVLGSRDVSRVTAKEIEEMYYLKTTRYTFEAPCVMGALLAGASEAKIEAIRNFVRPLGLAFQIDNDLLEFRYIDKEMVGFPTDLLEGKKTMLVHETFESLNDVDRSFFQMCLGSERKTESTLVKIYDLIRRSGSLDRLALKTRELFEQSERQLESGDFTEVEAATLRKAIQGVKSQIKVGA
ncbi:MAG: polyprenyl synthetase family protein [Verrucomicrobiota bacterium]